MSVPDTALRPTDKKVIATDAQVSRNGWHCILAPKLNYMPRTDGYEGAVAGAEVRFLLANLPRGDWRIHPDSKCVWFKWPDEAVLFRSFGSGR